MTQPDEAHLLHATCQGGEDVDLDDAQRFEFGGHVVHPSMTKVSGCLLA